MQKPINEPSKNSNDFLGHEKPNKKSISHVLNFSIINLDKPKEFTSHDAVSKIKKILNVKRAGHCGTLDPMVTGVLPIMINRACRLSNYFMKKDKEYIGKMLLHRDVSIDELKKEMNKLTGKIMQKPPVKSSVKRVLREREISKFEIINKKDRVVEFIADVEAGTYIRKLISDLGEKIGGAHMIELRRTKAGMFNIKDSFTLEEIEKAFEEYKNGNEKELRKILIPGEIIKEVLEEIQVKEESLKKLLNGKPLMIEDLVKNKKIKDDRFCVFFKDRFIGVYRKTPDAEHSSGNSIIGKAEFVKP